MPTPDLSAARFFADLPDPRRDRTREHKVVCAEPRRCPGLPDPRRDRTREHGLTDILVIALAAIAGAESFEAVAAFGRAGEEGRAGPVLPARPRPGVAAVLSVLRERAVGDEVATKVHDYVTSLRGAAEHSSPGPRAVRHCGSWPCWWSPRRARSSSASRLRLSGPSR